MLKKFVLGFTVAVVLVVAGNLFAQEKAGQPKAALGQGMNVMGERPRGPRPGQDPPPTQQRFDNWLNELRKAHQENDSEKIGQLLKDMDRNRQRLQRGMGRPDRGMRPPQGQPMRGATGTSSIESSPMPKTEAEKKILSVLEDIHQNQRRGMMNVPPEDGRLLRLLSETIGAKHVVEIGTSNGYSGIWFCLALRTTGGELTTYEIDARRASLARQNLKRAGVDKIVTLVEGDAHKTVTKLKEPIDILFLDADKEGYIDYLNKLLPLVRPGGLVVAHNMTPRQADPRFVKAITTNPDLETIFLHMQASGVSVSLKKR
ncbi:O-methyltransferase [bacterium]|nr:O-methyltransferase [bacterium]